MDCSIYTNSIPGKNYFTNSDIEEGDLDKETIEQFRQKFPTHKMNKSAHVIHDFSAVKFQRQAYASYDKYYNPVNEEDYTKIYLNGTISCFCQAEYAKFGSALLWKYYRKDGYDQLPPKMFELI